MTVDLMANLEASLDAALARPADRVSATYAQSFDECPKAAQLGHGVGAYGQMLSRGTIAHDFAQTVAAQCVEARQPFYPVEHARGLMTRIIMEHDEVVGTEEQDFLLDELAETFCRSHTFDVDHVEDLESEYAVTVTGTVQPAPGMPRRPFAVMLSCKPDLVVVNGSHGEVHDYKTSRAVDPESAIEGTFQARAYTVGMFDAFPQLETVDPVWDYVRFGETGIRRPKQPYTRDDLPRLREYLSAKVGRILRARATNKWPAMPGDHCSRCPDPAACPLTTAERGTGAPVDAKQAKRYAEQTVVLDAVLSMRKKQLRAWVKEHGPLVAGAGRFDFATSEDSLRLDEAAKQRMIDEGVDWTQYAKRVKGSSRFGYVKEGK